MPQPATTPTPGAPAPAQAPSATVLLPEGPLPLEGLPRNAQELQGLRARRDILRDHLERATTRRSQLVSQLDRGDVGDAGRAGIQQRLALLDQRILQIEGEQAMTERLLANAPPGVLAQTVQPQRPPNVIDEDEAAFIAFTTFGVGVLLTLFVGRLRRRFGRRRAAAGRSPGVATLAEDPRFERLSLTVDAMAEELERIGEGQRFVTQLLAGQQREAQLVPMQQGEAERQ
jgi:hypothetical protein